MEGLIVFHVLKAMNSFDEVLLKFFELGDEVGF